MTKCHKKFKSGFNDKSKGSFYYTSSMELQCNLYRNELMKYDKLKYLIIDTFKTYMTYFKLGHFDTLEQQFINNEALRLGQVLVDNTLTTFSNFDIHTFQTYGTLFSKTKTNTIFTDYTTFIHLLIDGLNSAISLNKTNTSYITINNQLQQYKDTLTDATKLQQYIEDNYNNFNSSLISVDMTTTAPIIKLEYDIYIRRYGIPCNGIFDSELLNRIIYEINHELL